MSFIRLYVYACMWRMNQYFDDRICGSLFENKKRLLEHHRKKHDGQRFRCDLCIPKKDFLGSPPSFSKKSSFDRHMQNVHQKKKWECGFCHAQFTTKSSLARHKKERTKCVNTAMKRTRVTGTDGKIVKVKNLRSKSCSKCGR